MKLGRGNARVLALESGPRQEGGSSLGPGLFLISARPHLARARESIQRCSDGKVAWRARPERAYLEVAPRLD
jgi:hypothetical protein